MNTDAFSHGQICSKLWLLEELEPLIPPDSLIEIYGSWYNVLGFMMKVRRPNFPYREISGYDIDPEVKSIADKINNAFTYPFGNLWNFTRNSNEHSSRADVVINCSPEHFENDTWFDNLHSGQLVCIQSSNVIDPTFPWLVTNPSPNINEFLSKYPLTKQLYQGTRQFIYPNLQYDRYMLIGVK